MQHLRWCSHGAGLGFLYLHFMFLCERLREFFGAPHRSGLFFASALFCIVFLSLSRHVDLSCTNYNYGRARARRLGAAPTTFDPNVWRRNTFASQVPREAEIGSSKLQQGAGSAPRDSSKRNTPRVVRFWYSASSRILPTPVRLLLCCVYLPRLLSRCYTTVGQRRPLGSWLVALYPRPLSLQDRAGLAHCCEVWGRGYGRIKNPGWCVITAVVPTWVKCPSFSLFTMGSLMI